MAAPTYLSTTSTTRNSNATAHNVNMPATVDAGDMLIAAVMIEDVLSVPSGWAAVPGITQGIYYKAADGTEDGGTAQWTSSNQTYLAANVIRVQAGTYSGIPRATNDATTHGSVTSADPPSVTPVAGSGDYLYMTALLFFALFSTQRTVSAYPSGYSGTTFASAFTAFAEQWACATAVKSATGSSSDDPSAFTISASASCFTGTWALAGVINATVNAAVMSATASMEVPSVSAGADVAAPAMAATGSFPVPDVAPTSNVDAVVMEATAQMLAPTPEYGSAIDAPAMAATASFPAPAIANDYENLAAVMAASGSMPAPTVQAGATVSPPSMDAAASFPAPAYSNDYENLAAVMQASGSMPAPTLSSSSNIEAPVMSASASMPAPDVGAGAIVAAAVMQATASFLAPLVRFIHARIGGLPALLRGKHDVAILDGGRDVSVLNDGRGKVDLL